MMKRPPKLLLLFFLLFSLFLPSKVEAEEVGYSVQAVLPENQKNSDVTYFDLHVEPDHEQELTLLISNHGGEEITVQGHIYDASTNRNGLVVYEEQEETDPSLENPLTELVTLEENQWTIPAGESKTVKAKLETPGEEFDGIKLGGFHFEKVPDEQEEAGEEGVTIQNRFAYVIALQLSQNNREVAPNLEIGSVGPQLVNYRTAVVAEVQNDQPLLMGGVTIQAKMYEQGEADPLREVEQTDIQMAPNSKMDFVVDLDNQPLEAGEYRLDMTATDGEDEWEWQETFEITKEDEVKNEEAVELDTTETTTQKSSWYNAGMAGLLAIIAVLVMYIKKLKNEQ